MKIKTIPLAALLREYFLLCKLLDSDWSVLRPSHNTFFLVKGHKPGNER